MNAENISTRMNLESLLYKILDKLELREDISSKKYYRNKDLKVLFGLSPNTISKYRDEGQLPYTLLGEIYLYPVNEVDKRLNKNASY
jgi:hypothetical protein